MSNSINSVLVTTDFSDVANNAVRTAAGICKRHGATLRLLHIVTYFDIAMPPLGHYAMVSTKLESMKHDVNEQLAAKAAEISQEWGILCTADEAMGAVPDAVATYADEHDCDLIVIGTHGASGLSQFFLGSNAIAILKRTTKPVLAVPQKAKAEAFKNILFPVRAVPHATDKYDFLKPIIEHNGATVHVAGVAALGGPDRFMYVNALSAELTRKLQADGVNFSLEKHFCPDVTDMVLQLAEKKGADLLVITSTLEKDFWELFSGPFSKKIIGKASMAVLMVRPQLDRPSSGASGETTAAEFPVAFG